MKNDLTFALRQLRKNPGFTAVALLSLVLGIAANTTIFSFVNALLLRPAPVEDPGGLWQVWRYRPKASSKLKHHVVWSRAAIAYLRAQNQMCSVLAAYNAEPLLTSWNHQGLGESVQSLFVSGNFFQACGIRPALGRFYLPEEDQTPGTHPVVVVSHAFWQNRLGSDPHAIGRALTLNGVVLTVVGVAPDDFAGVTAGIAPDLWIPFMMAPAVLHHPEWLTRTDSHSVIGLARLNPGVAPEQAAAELSVLTRRFDDSLPGEVDRESAAILLPTLLVPLPLRGSRIPLAATLQDESRGLATRRSPFMNALIVGIVPTGRYRSLGEDERPAVYDCFSQGTHRWFTLVAHVRGPSGPIQSEIRNLVRTLDPRVALTQLSTLEQHLSLARFPMRTSGLLLGILGLVAWILAVSGLFGVIAYSVSQRTREVGIRMALGAERRQVLQLVMRQGLWLAGMGMVLGIGGAVAATRFLRSLLFGVTATDPLSFVAVPMLLLAAALVACWWPARRASGLDPMVALRSR